MIYALFALAAFFMIMTIIEYNKGLKNHLHTKETMIYSFLCVITCITILILIVLE